MASFAWSAWSASDDIKVAVHSKNYTQEAIYADSKWTVTVIEEAGGADGESSHKKLVTVG